MKIGIDISQLAYANTGVANYLSHLVSEMVKNKNHKYVLFFSSLRGEVPSEIQALSKESNVVVKRLRIPPKVLSHMWNKMHVIPVETFIGNVDMFISSDWTEPPVKKAQKATILYDLIVYKYPKETAKTIIETQKQKLKWVKKESSIVFCISKATKKDAEKILGIPSEKLQVIYPGFTL